MKQHQPLNNTATFIYHEPPRYLQYQQLQLSVDRQCLHKHNASLGRNLQTHNINHQPRHWLIRKGQRLTALPLTSETACPYVPVDVQQCRLAGGRAKQEKWSIVTSTSTLQNTWRFLWVIKGLQPATFITALHCRHISQQVMQPNLVLVQRPATTLKGHTLEHQQLQLALQPLISSNLMLLLCSSAAATALAPSSPIPDQGSNSCCSVLQYFSPAANAAPPLTLRLFQPSRSTCSCLYSPVGRQTRKKSIKIAAPLGMCRTHTFSHCCRWP